MVQIAAEKTDKVRMGQELKVFSQFRQLARYNHTLFIHTSFFPFPLSAIVKEIDEEAAAVQVFFYLQSGNLLEEGQQILITLDMEVDEVDYEDGPRLFSIENLRANVSRVGKHSWVAKCLIADETLYSTDRRGGVRIPFMHGMKADVSLAFDEFHQVETALVRNLSQGGCLLAVPIEDSFAFYIDQSIRALTIIFPNGDNIVSSATVRHIRPFGQARYINIGFQFTDPDAHQQARLVKYVTDCQAELAMLCGVDHRSEGRTKLFRANTTLASRERKEEKNDSAPKATAMVKFLRETARDLHRTAYYIKNDSPFPMEVINDAADHILVLLRENRTQLLYSLSYLLHEPQWVRHSIAVAVGLADSIIDDEAHTGRVRDAVSGCLLHNMGKMLLLGDRIPTLNTALSNQQKNLMKSHIELLDQYFERHQFPLPPTVRETLLLANEQLDGSGYPQGLQAEAIPSLVKTLSVIKIIDVLRHPRNERTSLSPLETYKWVYARPAQYEQSALLRYVKRYGFFPVGSLARFSAGFLAWIMEVDEEGSPAVVRVTRNLAYPDNHLNTVLSRSDFPQIGKLEKVICPYEYGEVNFLEQDQY